MRRVRRKEGDIVKIGLGDGTHAYARVLYDPLMAFYDCRTRREMTPDEIIAKPIAFKVNVMHDAIKSGRWVVVGNKPLEAEMKTPVHFFRQDVTDKNRISIYWQVERGPDVVEIPVAFEECVGLEPGVVWYANHVEDRLRDHFAKRPSKWLESLKLYRPPAH